MFFMMMGLLVLTITKRQQISVFVRGAGQRHLRGFTNPDYTDDNDDFEVWNRADIKSSSADSAAFPKNTWRTDDLRIEILSFLFSITHSS